MILKKTPFALASVLFFSGVLTGCSRPVPVCETNNYQACHNLRASYAKKLKQYDMKIIRDTHKAIVFIPTDQYFIGVSTTVYPSKVKGFNALAAYIKLYPLAKVTIRGYSDNVMKPSMNKRLTDLRARKLAGYLWTLNVPSQVLPAKSIGEGEKSPIASNKRLLGMADNRRIEVTIERPCK